MRKTTATLALALSGALLAGSACRPAPEDVKFTGTTLPPAPAPPAQDAPAPAPPAQDAPAPAPPPGG